MDLESHSYLTMNLLLNCRYFDSVACNENLIISYTFYQIFCLSLRKFSIQEIDVGRLGSLADWATHVNACISTCYD